MKNATALNNAINAKLNNKTWLYTDEKSKHSLDVFEGYTRMIHYNDLSGDLRNEYLKLQGLQG